jgi:hypothetical protein
MGYPPQLAKLTPESVQIHSEHTKSALVLFYQNIHGDCVSAVVLN